MMGKLNDLREQVDPQPLDQGQQKGKGGEFKDRWAEMKMSLNVMLLPPGQDKMSDLGTFP